MPARRSLWVWGAVAAVIAGSATAELAHLRAGGKSSRPGATTVAALQTAVVTRADISSSEPQQGSIGFGRTWTIKAAGAGIVTWLPAGGAKLVRGAQVYRVDDQPIALFYGRLPLFRALDHVGMVGRDVRVVADNLRALGYRIGDQPASGSSISQPATAGKTAPPSTVLHAGESVLTADLIQAIKRWQRDRQLPETGHLARTDVVIEPGPIRVASVTAQIGDAGGDLMSVSGTAKVISVPVDAGSAGSITLGEQVTVVLPDGGRKPAKVTAIGAQSAKPDDDQGGGSGGTQKLTVTLTAVHPADIEKVDSADVEVDFAAETHKGVLTVPVGALLALSEGGYGVQISGGPLLPVKTGLISKGMAEVSGNALAEGARVVTTS
jgi:hypothetical protein